MCNLKRNKLKGKQVATCLLASVKSTVKELALEPHVS